MSMTKDEAINYMREGRGDNAAGVEAGKRALHKATDLLLDIVPNKDRDVDTITIQTRRLAFEIGLWQELDRMSKAYDDMPRKIRKGLTPEGARAIKSIYFAKVLSEMINEANEYVDTKSKKED